MEKKEKLPLDKISQAEQMGISILSLA